MDKPMSMSVKEHIYRKISLENDIAFSTVRAVIDNQFQTALTALTDVNNNSLEIAGLGKVLLNKRRLKAEIRKLKYFLEYYPKYLLIPDLTLREIEDTEEKLQRVPLQLEQYLLRAEALKIIVEPELNIEEKIKAGINKKIKARQDEFKKD
jgi:hypothetical protein